MLFDIIYYGFGIAVLIAGLLCLGNIYNRLNPSQHARDNRRH